MESIIKSEFCEHLQVTQATLDNIAGSLEQAVKYCVNSIHSGGKILIFGNGGSAADAQHIAAEFVGRYKKERQGLPAIALTTDTSAITSIGNDYGYAHIFARQIEALANAKDVVIGISSSGNSDNVLKALALAKKMGCHTIGMTGKGGGKMEVVCDVNLVVPSQDTARIQEMHILIGHTICHLVEKIHIDQCLN